MWLNSGTWFAVPPAAPALLASLCPTASVDGQLEGEAKQLPSRALPFTTGPYWVGYLTFLSLDFQICKTEIKNSGCLTGL